MAKRSLYRIKSLDPVNDICVLQERVFLFWWKIVSVGPRDKLLKFIAEENLKEA